MQINNNNRRGGTQPPWFCCLLEVVSLPAPPGHAHGRRSAIVLSRDPARLTTLLNNREPLTRNGYEDLSGAIRRLASFAGANADPAQKDRELPPPPTRSATLEGGGASAAQTEQEERLRHVLEYASDQLSACILPDMFSPSAPSDWIARTEAAIDAHDACALSREIESGYVNIQEATRRLDHLRRVLIENSRVTTHSVPEWLTPIDEYRRANEVERKKRRSAAPPPVAKRKARPAAAEEEPSLFSQDSNTSDTGATATAAASSLPVHKCAYRLAMIIGPLQSYERARTVGMLWGLQGHSMVSRGALGELLACHYSLSVHADLGVVFGAERLQHYVLRQTPSGELWMLARKDAEQQKLSLFDCITTDARPESI